MSAMIANRVCLTAIALACLAFLNPALLAREPVRILLLSGQNNHAWEETSPLLEEFLDQLEHFQVCTTFHPEQLSPSDLREIDVIVSNWNNYPSPHRPVNVSEWPEETRRAYVDFVRNGGGHVNLHAGGSSFYDWDDYFAISLMRWGKEHTTHGWPHDFPVRIEDRQHPITKGLEDFEKWDELWRRPEIHPDAQVLTSSFSSLEDGGTESYEPSILVGQFGQGRCFATTLGHDVRALHNSSFLTLLARGIEWAATGKVTVDPGTFEAEKRLDWSKSSGHLSLYQGGTPRWQFNTGPTDSKPSFHPLRLPDGSILTGMRPDDHTWHRGAWFSWKFLNGKNFWEEDEAGTPRDGLTVVRSKRLHENADHTGEIDLEIDYPLKSGELLLTEQRRIELSAPNSRGEYTITSHHLFTAKERTVINNYYYGGFSLRMAADQRQDWSFIGPNGIYGTARESSFKRTDQGMVLTGPPAPWVAFVEKDSGPTQGVAILDHPSNPRHPVRWLTIPKMPFFSPIVHHAEDLVLETGDTLSLRYRVVVFQQDDPQAFLRSAFIQFAEEF